MRKPIIFLSILIWIALPAGCEWNGDIYMDEAVADSGIIPSDPTGTGTAKDADTGSQTDSTDTEADMPATGTPTETVNDGTGSGSESETDTGSVPGDDWDDGRFRDSEQAGPRKWGGLNVIAVMPDDFPWDTVLDQSPNMWIAAYLCPTARNRAENEACKEDHLADTQLPVGWETEAIQIYFPEAEISGIDENVHVLVEISANDAPYGFEGSWKIISFGESKESVDLKGDMRMKEVTIRLQMAE